MPGTQPTKVDYIVTLACLSLVYGIPYAFNFGGILKQEQ